MADLTRLDGRVALVTGGSRGIGRAICLSLAERGATVAVHYRVQAAAGAVVEQIRVQGGSGAAFQADLSAPDAADNLLRIVNDKIGPVAILVNNAGEMTDAAVADMTDDQWEQALASI